MSPPSRPSHGLLGIDLGTSSVKTVVTDTGAAVLAHVVRPYTVEHAHPAWAETNPGSWWNAVVEGVREAVTAAGVNIAGIGLSGQMHGVVLTDPAGQPLRPAVLWSDSRATGILSAYRQLPTQTIHRLANPLSPGMFGPILGWLVIHEPHIYRSARWALAPKDWIRFRLTGSIASEPSDASATLLYDLPGDTWDRQVTQALGVDHAVLPPLLPHAAARAGALQPAAAAALGLPTGIPVAAGGADTAVAAFGAGIVAPGQGQLTIGTGIQIVAPVGAATPPAGTPVTHLYRAATDRGWYRMAAALNGGATLDWVRRLFNATWSELYAAADRPTAGDAPIFLPHLLGERTPYMDTSLRGSWAYLDPRHNRADMLHAALEGVAMTTRAAWTALQAAGVDCGTLRLAGGGTTSPAWQQMLADTLQTTLEPVDVPAASGLGAALLGGRAAGLFDQTRAIAIVTAAGRPAAVTHDPAAAPAITERFARFERLLHAEHAAAQEHLPVPVS